MNSKQFLFRLQVSFGAAAGIPQTTGEKAGSTGSDVAGWLDQSSIHPVTRWVISAGGQQEMRRQDSFADLFMIGSRSVMNG